MKNKMRHKKFFRLVLVALAAAGFFSTALFAAEINFISVRNEIYAGQPVVFTAFIPNVALSEVTIATPDFPRGVNFITSRIFESLIQSQRGVQIELEISFDNEGNFSLPSVTAFAGKKKHELVFEKISVLQKTSEAAPEIFLRFCDSLDKIELGNTALLPIANFSAAVNSTFYIIVFIKNAKLHSNVSWTLPENSIFAKLDFEGKAALPDAELLGVFEWTVFRQGQMAVPVFSVEAESLAGKRMKVASPEISIDIYAANIAQEQKNYEDSQPPIFPNAFSSLADENKLPAESGAATMSHEEMLVLTEKLRSEKKTIHMAKNFLGILTAICLCAFVFLGIMSFAKKQAYKKLCLIAAFGFVAAMCSYIFFAAQSRYDVGVFCGASISVIPEETSSINIQLQQGAKVKILRQVGDWLFLQTEAGNGWAKEGDVIAG